jgi:glucose/arabinose dehydrogenase
MILLIMGILLFPNSSSLWALGSSPKNYVGKDVSLHTIISEGISKPVFLTHSNDGSGRLFVVEQNGRILILEKGKLLPTPFLDISALLATGGERGLLGLAFHPNYRKNGRYFLNYTREQDGATVIAEYHASSNPIRSETQERVLLVIPQPYGNHNGGMVAFGPDGYLFVATGDGGSGGDPGNRGQNPSELLGKILRIDVDHGAPYGIPSTNPFSRNDGRPEIFAIGFRNPWRFSFDRQTGELWAGDVGQNDWEEINIVKVGENHGWRLMEGSHCYKPSEGCQGSAKVTMPVTEYANAGPRCSVIGGYVYRGRKVPSLYGTYIFGDYCSGEIFGFREGKQTVLLDSGLQITSFGEDEYGELYVLNHTGSIHQIIKSADSRK